MAQLPDNKAEKCESIILNIIKMDTCLDSECKYIRPVLLCQLHLRTFTCNDKL